MNLDDLKLPFEENEIEWRISQCGSTNGKVWANCLAYISARAAQDRLDKVCGPSKWRVDYILIQDKAAICTITIDCGEDGLVTKQDGAEMTEIESFKGGLSSAFKRAASVWGIGRYLYDLPVGFAQIVDKNDQRARYGKIKDGPIFYWVPPELPRWALPKKENETSEATKEASPKSGLETAPVPQPDINIDMKFDYPPFKGQTIMQVLNSDSAGKPKQFPYCFEILEYKKKGRKISKAAEEYLKLCKQEGVF